MWIKIVSIITLILALFLIPFWVDFLINFRTPHEVLDPLKLSTNLLKMILDERGISYRALLEKYELAKAVNDSGIITSTSLRYIFTTKSFALFDYFDFTQSDNLNMKFNETSDKSFYDVQVFQIKPFNSNHFMINLKEWSLLSSKFRRFRIYLGLISCEEIPNDCKSRNWQQHQILTVIPKSAITNDLVVMTSSKAPNSEVISEWIKHSINQRIIKIKSYEEVDHWLSNKIYSGVPKMILVADLEEPPLFYSILGARFAGKVKFGFYSVRNILSREKLFDEPDSVFSNSMPYYLFTLNNHTIRYGSHYGHFFNSHALGIFLNTVILNMDSIFMATLWIVNIIITIKLLLFTYGDLWKYCVKCIWYVAVCNFMLFAFWLIVLKLTPFPLVDAVFTTCLINYQNIATSIVGDLLRYSFMFWEKNIIDLWILLLSYLTLSVLMIYKEEVNATQVAMVTHDNVDNYLPAASLPNYPSSEIGIQSGMEYLIERLAIPNLWLPSSVSQSFIHRLPTWIHCGQHCPESELSSTETDTEEVDSPIYYSNPLQYFLKYKKDGAQHQEFTCQCPPGSTTCEQCAICLETFKKGDHLCGLPCSHNFHHGCIILWLENSTLCPICRWPAEKRK